MVFFLFQGSLRRFSLASNNTKDERFGWHSQKSSDSSGFNMKDKNHRPPLSASIHWFLPHTLFLYIITIHVATGLTCGRIPGRASGVFCASTHRDKARRVWLLSQLVTLCWHSPRQWGIGIEPMAFWQEVARSTSWASTFSPLPPLSHTHIPLNLNLFYKIFSVKGLHNYMYIPKRILRWES